MPFDMSISVSRISDAPPACVAVFMADWAQRLADWMSELLPANVIARAKRVHGQAGIQLCAKRDPQSARHAHPLNLFLLWQVDEIEAFLAAPLQNTIKFQERIRAWLVRFGEPESIDFLGGSQHSESVIVFRLEDFGVQLAA
jgi:hypothetical protein